MEDREKWKDIVDGRRTAGGRNKTVDSAAKQAKKHCINSGARIPNE